MFKVNDRVQVLQRGKWLNAILIKHSPYYRRTYTIEGFEYRYDPLPKTDPITHISPSMGGWISINCIKER